MVDILDEKVSLPKVTIICICYNHLPYLEVSIRSALRQEYDNVEVIVADDGSTDGSQELLRKLSESLGFRLIINGKNLGNCATFNRAFALSSGEYIIDLSTDDILLPQRVSCGVKEFQPAGQAYGVHFTDHEWIDKSGKSLGYHYKRNDLGDIKEDVPSGDIYADVLEQYFISAPTMMIRKEVLVELGGYDESLSYEDFDFWVRSSRKWKYLFSDEVLVQKRRLEKSLSNQQFRFASQHDRSTYRVCKKAFDLNVSLDEHNALVRRLKYERKHAVINGNLQLARDYSELIGLVKLKAKQMPG